MIKDNESNVLFMATISVYSSNASWHCMLETSESGLKASTSLELGMGEQAFTHRCDSPKLQHQTPEPADSNCL